MALWSEGGKRVVVDVARARALMIDDDDDDWHDGVDRSA